MAGPLDLRLVRHASATRWTLVATAGIALVQAVATAAAAWSAAAAISALVSGEGRMPWAEIAGFAAAIAVRAAAAFAFDPVTARGAATVKRQLRALALDSLAPGRVSGTARTATVLTSGLDALDGYFGRYLPQLVLAAVAVPLLGIAVLVADPESALLVLVTIPVIPIFMVLIGWATRGAQRAQWDALQSLSTRFLAIVDGLSTLTLFGRQHRQAQRIESSTDEYRRRTMSVLRVTFVSGFVLELAGTLAVAVVAVAIGVRLIDGTLPLVIGLFVLLLVPDVFAPLRRVGAEYHASADGVAAADELFELIGAPAADGGSARASGTLAVRGLTVRYGETIVVDRLDASFEPGRITAITGPSGIGKSTLVAALLGFVEHEGDVLLGGETVAHGREAIAWAPQHPALAAGSVAENIAMGDIDENVLARCMRLAAIDAVDPALRLEQDGAGVSGGQAQRLAIARAIYRALDRDCPVLVLDEPTSALDAATETEVLAGLRSLAEEGRAVVIVSHREAVIAAADRVLQLGVRRREAVLA